MNWERSERYEEFEGCRLCVHYRRGRCVAFPERIPIDFLSGEVDHMVRRPGQVGDTVFEPMDFEVWLRTRQRVQLGGSPAAVKR